MCRLADIEIDILVRKNEALKDEVCKLRTENERLQKERIERIRELTKVVYDTEFAEAKAEAVKEFAERLKKEFKPEINYGVVANCAIKLFRNTIDYLVKEMTENEGKE